MDSDDGIHSEPANPAHAGFNSEEEHSDAPSSEEEWKFSQLQALADLDTLAKDMAAIPKEDEDVRPKWEDGFAPYPLYVFFHRCNGTRHWCWNDAGRSEVGDQFLCASASRAKPENICRGNGVALLGRRGATCASCIAEAKAHSVVRYKEFEQLKL